MPSQLCQSAACGGEVSGGSGRDAGAPGWDPADFDAVYDVGPGKPYADPSEVPWESLGPSTLVRVFWRAEPYRAKWVINTEATATDPLVVLGVPDAGRLPVISGDGAITRLALSYWNENRSVIKVGGANLPDDMRVPSYVIIESLDGRSARPAYAFTDDGGNAASYADNAAAVHVEIGQHVTVRGCDLHDAGNHVYDNGITASAYQHNSYTEAFGITFEYNHYGPLRAGCDGNNLKDRSAGTVIRYNWIESGNRQLDLVESADARDNIVVATAGDGRLAITSGTGAAALHDNWLQQGWRATHDTLEGTVDDLGNTVGAAPGFVALGGQNFALAPGSPCIGQAGALAPGAVGHPVTREYVRHQAGAVRPDDGDPDIGAFERAP